MTRRDYVAIAAALKNARGLPMRDHASSLEAAAQCIADVMARDNPRFDRARFLKTAGVQS